MTKVTPLQTRPGGRHPAASLIFGRDVRVLRREHGKPGIRYAQFGAELDRTDHEVASKAHRLGLSWATNVAICNGCELLESTSCRSPAR
jgi:hypothetical protein